MDANQRKENARPLGATLGERLAARAPKLKRRPSEVVRDQPLPHDLSYCVSEEAPRWKEEQK